MIATLLLHGLFLETDRKFASGTVVKGALINSFWNCLGFLKTKCVFDGMLKILLLHWLLIIVFCSITLLSIHLNHNTSTASTFSSNEYCNKNTKIVTCSFQFASGFLAQSSRSSSLLVTWLLSSQALCIFIVLDHMICVNNAIQNHSTLKHSLWRLWTT